MVLVSHWFRRNKRGPAAGMIIAGNGLAIILSGQIVPILNSIYGWRSSWAVLAFVIFMTLRLKVTQTQTP